MTLSHYQILLIWGTGLHGGNTPFLTALAKAGIEHRRSAPGYLSTNISEDPLNERKGCPQKNMQEQFQVTDIKNLVL